MRKLLLSVLGFIILIGGSFFFYKSGYLEKILSRTTIPFSIFKENTKIDISKKEIEIHSIPETAKVKEELSDITKKFSLDNKEKPVIQSNNIDDQSKELLEKEFDAIYSVPNNFIGKANIIGFKVTNQGVGVLVNFAVYQDSKDIKNNIFTFLRKDSVYSVSKEQELISDAALLELPDNYNFDKIIESNNLINNLFKKDFSVNFPVLKSVSGEQNNVTSEINYIYQNQLIQLTRTFGLKDKVEDFSITIPIDNISVEKIQINK